MEIPEAAETEAAPAPEGAQETPAPETLAQETPAQEAPATETPAQEAMPEEILPDTPAPKARAKGRPKGSKTQNRRPKATADPEAAEFASVPSAVVETPPDIFEIIRQRQTAQFERRQAFYQSFLPVR